jgi:UrcA family protein
MLKTLSALAAVAVASALVVPTVSQAQDTQSVRVSYADLNLASNTGQAKLQQRIDYAAKYVCEGDLSNIDYVSAIYACRADAVAGARPAFEAAVAEATRHGTVTVLDTASLVVTKQ